MDDPYNLERFVLAQRDDYELALSEIVTGRKRSHWMWYIFPQIGGLGSSAMSRPYSIKSRWRPGRISITPCLDLVCWLVSRLCLVSRVGRWSKSSDTLMTG